MQLHHFDVLPSHCPHATCIIRFARPVSASTHRAILERLAAAAAVELGDDELGDEPTAFVVAPWLPRAQQAHAAAIEQVQALAAEGADGAWLFAVGTTIDALAAAAAQEQQGEDDDDDDDDDDAENHDDDDDDDDSESHWRHGPPPGQSEVPFVLEGYPEILDEFDWEDFGIAVKLAGERVPGEERVLAAMHGVWIASYIDRRAEEAPLRHTAVTWDGASRAASIWVDRFCPPATVVQMVEHLLWIAARIHELVPLAHARFAGASMEQKYAALGEDPPPPFVLAGNPLRAQVEADETAAEAWMTTQTLWTKRELAAMLVELGTDLDPDDPEQGARAAARFDRATALDPDNDDARSYAVVALVRSGRVDAALARARASNEPTMRGYTFGLVAEHAPARIREAIDLLDAATLDGIAEEKVGEIVATVGAHAPERLLEVLERVPRSAAMVAHLYNASFKVEDQPLRLHLLELVMDLPAPEPDAGPHRAAYTFAFNNACVLAHAMKQFPRAAAIADRAQAYAEENPYIFHGAACAYVAIGEFDKAMYQVERAVARDYDHLDKLELDSDLGELLRWPRFVELFATHRAKLAAAEPVRETDSAGFAATVLGADRPVLVEFTASWCGPCKRQAPILDKLARGADGRFRIVKVDIDACPDLAGRYDATSVPTLVVFHHGREVARTVGLSQPDELLELIARASDA